MTSASKPIVQHFEKYAKDIFKKYFINKKNITILEIGSNDGSLLNEFKKLGANTIGIEPAKNLAKVANHKGIRTLNEFFSINLANKISKVEKISVIVANNVVGHIEDLHELMKGVKILIKNNGIFIFEVPYLLDLIKNREFDTIYHEHLSYFSLLPLINLTKKFGLEIFDIEKQNVHGGTIRVYVSKKGKFKIKNSVKKFSELEKSFGIHKKETYMRFKNDVEKNKNEIVKKIEMLSKDGYTIFGYGATAKGNVLLNYCKINHKILEFIIDTTKIKQGRFTPGTHIPIVNPRIMNNIGRKNVALLLAWNYKKEILDKEKIFRKNGGKFLIPVPNAIIK